MVFFFVDVGFLGFWLLLYKWVKSNSVVYIYDEYEIYWILSSINLREEYVGEWKLGLWFILLDFLV